MIDWANFHFLRPEWFWALLPLSLLLVAMHYVQTKKSGWHNLIAAHLSQKLLEGKIAAASNSYRWLLPISWLLAVSALAGPSWERLPQPVYQLHTGKVLVMDMSLSMRATDIKPDRLTRARYKAIDLINQSAEGEMGLVAYAGDGFVISPLSTDALNLTTLIPALEPEIMPVLGSDPMAGLQAASELLSSAGYQQGDIFWITDGIDNDQVAELREYLNGIPYRVSVLLVGTEQGAPVTLKNGQFLKNRRGDIVVPKSFDHQLKSLAAQTGGVLVHMQADASDIDYITRQTLVERDTNDEQQDDNQGDQWQEAGPWLLLPILLFAAASFRRGWLLSVVGALMLTQPTKPVYASDIASAWHTRDQLAQQAFEQGEFKQAAALFENPMWRGIAAYKAEDYETAAQAFSQASGIEAQYNLANSLAQLGQLDDAIALYDAVLGQQPQHSDAKANKALLEHLKKQQEEQQKQQEEQAQQNEQQQQDSQQQNDEQESEQNQQQSEQQQSESDASEQEQQQEEQQSEQQAQESDAQEQQERSAEESSALEQQMQLENLLNKVPDDPSYLLKRKMLLEYQQRRRTQTLSPAEENW